MAAKPERLHTVWSICLFLHLPYDWTIPATGSPARGKELKKFKNLAS
jgi:hypothetical protein